ncbi:aldehyde oxidase and xanthine dehydrogenase molybdopterin binding [Solidesulfovibrio fructosivorans JJ]]|uniref:Aldehyde oxidase and xanthine dehydrogenase molybdopterin binding n=1 Tax=Solidesulfovibrio fructosivorans JJ] TaxID=596151 RepID=E1JTQ3_SOLFR|nr:xanthine dehydrogenase family protein [Solidesulfovibrio fructosivorans]EFL52182.1 aldehyde oxidase and xanthine dehydrogenase molybdopterin binding [Solidesulfovibrio fructosivorans JJ]]
MATNETLFTPKLTGRNYTTPDLRAKLTGTARYADDFRAEGMLVCKLLTSPMPHAKVKRLDTKAALAIPGVRAILTADDLPPPADSVTDRGEVIKASPFAERALTMEPLYQGEPILAVAATDEAAAVAAIEAIDIEYEPLPFVINPLDSLRPDGPNARGAGNVWLPPGQGETRARVGLFKWTRSDFAAAGPDRLPLGKATGEWSFGDVEAGLQKADLVLDETFVTPNVSHQALETRSTLAWWENGKLHLAAGTQSTIQTVPALARWMNMDPADIVFVSQYTGGGFGGKITASIPVVIPALLARKTNAPVMMRVTREEEQYIGRARPSLIGRMRAGFSKEGRLTALDMFVVMDNGPYEEQYDAFISGRMASLLYQPRAMRWRGVTVLTNTPTRAAQTSPGGLQAQAFMGPVLAKAAKRLKLDPLAVCRINSPEGRAPVGPPKPDGTLHAATSAFVKEALDQGAEAFGWQRRRDRPAPDNGPVRRGLGVATGCFVAGTIGFDGLFVITPEGRLRIHTGVGNLGTESFSDVQRVVADAMDVPWEACEILWGDTGKHLGWSCVSGGSQTVHAMSRAGLAASLDAKRKLREIAARTLGGGPEEYAVGGGRVFRAATGQGLSFAEAAKRAIALGGAYDGHECPDDVHKLTKVSVAALAGQGLVAVAKDAFGRDGQTYSYVAAFAEVAVDTETGMYRITDFHAQADAGRIVHPQAFGGQVFGRSMLGIGHATSQKWFYDTHYGLPVAKRFYQTRPPTILSAPEKFSWGAVGRPDPQTPVGARGIGEPPTGAACAAVLCALADALGEDAFVRAPIMADTVLAALAPGAELPVGGLAANA